MEDKGIFKLTADIREELKDINIVDDLQEKICKEFMEIINKHKDLLLIAWSVTYGFEPNRAVFVEDRTDPIKIKFYIEERKDQ